MRRFRPHCVLTTLASLALCVMTLLSLAPALATSQPQQRLFGYSRVLLPFVYKPVELPPLPPSESEAKVVVWLDIPNQVRLSDRLQVVVHIENKGKADFRGRTEVVMPYDGRRYVAVDSSFDRQKGDWIKENRFPTNLTIDFGPVNKGEQRRGVVYFSLNSGGADARVGDKVQIRADYSNGKLSCGDPTCPTNQRRVEVVSQFTDGGIGTLPAGTRQTQKLGDIQYTEKRRWVPQGFRPDEQVVTWLNLPGGGQRPLTLQQKADRDGKVYFTIDVGGLKNGFYSIVAHGIDTQIEIVGEFRIVNSPITSLAAPNRLTLLPARPSASADDSAVQLAEAPAQATGSGILAGVVASAGTAGATRLAGVQVNVVAADGTVVGATATDDFGGYLVTGLPAGSYTVVFDPHLSFDDAAARYQPKTFTNIVIPATGTVPLDVELQPGASVSGTVTGAGNGSLEGVSVLLLSGNTVAEATTTTSDGSYQLEGIPSGSYTLLFDPATSDDEAVRAFTAISSTVALSAPAPLGGQNAVLPRSVQTVEISGQIVASNTGEPLPDVYVIFERLNTTTSQYEYADLVVSDATGSYSGVLPPGKYHVSFRPDFSDNPDSARYLAEYFTDAASAATATEIDLTVSTSARADAALVSGATIAGTVTGDGNPLADVVVLTFDTTSGELVDVTLSADDGTYRTAGLPAGSYRLEFLTYLSDNATTQAYAGTTVAGPIVLAAGASVSGIDAALTLGGGIAGKVTGTGGIPLADVLVVAVDTKNSATTDDDELAGLALTGDDGVYTMTGMLAGSYVVAFITELTGDSGVIAYFDEYYDNTTDPGSAKLVSVVAGGTTPNIDATLTQGGQISGRVTDEVDGFGIAGVLVEVYDVADPTTLVAFAITDEGGDYATTALTPGGSYVVRFDPSFGDGTVAYAPEYFDNASEITSAQAVNVPTTAPVAGVNAQLAKLP